MTDLMILGLAFKRIGDGSTFWRETEIGDFRIYKPRRAALYECEFSFLAKHIAPISGFGETPDAALASALSQPRFKTFVEGWTGLVAGAQAFAGATGMTR